jgi:hypothetical protein
MPTPPEMDWLPTLAEPQRRHPRIDEWTETVEPLLASYTPAPDILAALWFFPCLDGAPQPRRTPPREATSFSEPFDTPTRIAPGVWRPLST